LSAIDIENNKQTKAEIMKRIAVVCSEFNREITEKLESGAVSYLRLQGIEPMVIHVPGAVEIPLACEWLLQKGMDAIVAIGAVIRGETSHYDLVCNSVERGVSELMLRWKKPIAFGVITTENEEQALERAGGRYGNKGEEAARVALTMLELFGRMNAHE
jgi:6,7-dimethyl-8-ribityllumazine synthase